MFALGLSGLAGFVLIWWGANTTVAPPSPTPDQVAVTLLVVHATNEGEVDPSLSALAPKLRAIDYSGFSLLREQTSSILEGHAKSFAVPGEREFHVEVVEVMNHSARLRVQLFRRGEQKLDTTFSIPHEQYFVVAGPRYKRGRLVLPIQVSGDAASRGDPP